MKLLTPEYLQQQIKNVTYSVEEDKGLTICYLTLNNDFVVFGHSFVLDKEKFDEKIGRDVAYEKAFDQLWVLYGFLEKNKSGGDYLFRLHNERTELEDRYLSLNAALKKEGFSEQVGEQQFELLQLQLETMKSYLEVLDKRLELIVVG